MHIARTRSVLPVALGLEQGLKTGLSQTEIRSHEMGPMHGRLDEAQSTQDWGLYFGEPLPVGMISNLEAYWAAIRGERNPSRTFRTQKSRSYGVLFPPPGMLESKAQQQN